MRDIIKQFKKSHLLIIGFFILFCDISSAEKLDREMVAELLRGLEDGYNVLEYEAEYAQGVAIAASVDFSKSISNFSALVEKINIRKQTHCLMEPGTGKLYYKREGTAWIRKGDTNSISLGYNYKEVGFDGQIRTQLMGGKDSYRTAVVSKEPIKINSELSSYEMGMDMFLACYAGVGLSRYLLSEEVDEDSVQGIINNDGILEISFQKKDTQRIRVFVDLDKRVILSEEYYSKNNPNTIVVKMEYNWQKNEKGYWVPTTGIGVAGVSNPTVHLWNYKNIQVNHFIPKKSDYCVTFPYGTEVQDEVAGISYTVGASPDEIEQQVQVTLMKSFELNPDLPGKTNTKQLFSDHKSFEAAVNDDEGKMSAHNPNTADGTADIRRNPGAFRKISGVLISVLGAVVLCVCCFRATQGI